MRLTQGVSLQHLRPPRKVGQGLRKWLIYPSVLTAVVALIWSLSFEIILDLPGDLAVQGLIFMLTFIFYNRDRMTASPSLDDEINMGDRTRWTARYQRGLKGVVRAAIVCAAVLLVVRPDAILAIMLGLGFALLYSMRCSA